ncbi:MAG: Xaa-Pro peptidase family protein [Candidatus Latescibacterota bacterium]
MTTRKQRLWAALDEIGASAFVACRWPNQLYLLDHPDPSSVISRGNCHAILFAPQQTVVFPGVWISNACRDLLGGCEVVTNDLGDPAPEQQLALRLQREGYRKVVCDQAGGALAALLAQTAAGLEVVADDVVTRLRRTKDDRDLAAMREAARVADLGMVAAFRAIRPGVRCADVIAEGVATMLRAGAEYADMRPASGEGTCYLDSAEDPRRVIRAGDMVFLDMIIHVHGYLGDMTRAGIVGEGTRQQRELLSTVQQAYALATGMMRPGAKAAGIYQAVVDHYAAGGLERYWVHHLSHGLGLGGDLPRIAHGSEDVLQAGDALSCEPGLYVPGVGGARVENMLHITPAGVEELTRCPLEPPMGS